MCWRSSDGTCGEKGSRVTFVEDEAFQRPLKVVKEARSGEND
jgi:hypothetical protein